MVCQPSDINQSMYEFNEWDDATCPYRELIGSLMYLSVGTRPDITHAVGVASRFLEKPKMVHERAVKRILRYIKRTLNFGLLYPSEKSNELRACSDADYAGCLQTRRSTSGSVFLLGRGIVSWGSERQNSVSLSTTESEYMAASQCVKELVWIKNMLNEIFGNELLKVTL